MVAVDVDDEAALGVLHEDGQRAAEARWQGGVPLRLECSGAGPGGSVCTMRRCTGCSWGGRGWGGVERGHAGGPSSGSGVRSNVRAIVPASPWTFCPESVIHWIFCTHAETPMPTLRGLCRALGDDLVPEGELPPEEVEVSGVHA